MANAQPILPEDATPEPSALHIGELSIPISAAASIVALLLLAIAIARLLPRDGKK